MLRKMMPLGSKSDLGSKATGWRLWAAVSTRAIVVFMSSCRQNYKCHPLILKFSLLPSLSLLAGTPYLWSFDYLQRVFQQFVALAG